MRQLGGHTEKQTGIHKKKHTYGTTTTTNDMRQLGGQTEKQTDIHKKNIPTVQLQLQMILDS